MPWPTAVADDNRIIIGFAVIFGFAGVGVIGRVGGFGLGAVRIQRLTRQFNGITNGFGGLVLR